MEQGWSRGWDGDPGKAGLGYREARGENWAGLHTWYLEVDEDGGNQHPKALQESPPNLDAQEPPGRWCSPRGKGSQDPSSSGAYSWPPRPVAVGGAQPGAAQKPF